MAQALPLVFGYVPVGFAFGVLAQKAGLSTAN
ncbi:MAG: branched-chain amino acid ABC transporter permease, partial [Chloroflexota bacterium]|nr:branched-chain amino acid ABC transporter permease [Chloroflexota bacterium]